MKHIYQIHENFKGSAYGVGTYIQMLIEIVKDTEYAVTIVYLFAETEQVHMCWNEGVRSLYIPKPVVGKSAELYYRNVFYILHSYIDPTDENCVHIHYRNCKTLISLLKEYFNFKVILTIHFASWLDYFSASEMKKWCTKIEAKIPLTPEEESYLEIFTEEQTLMNVYCDRIVTIAEHAAKSVCWFYKIPPRKITILYNYLDDKRLKSPRLNRSDFCYPNEKIILFVGRLDANKNPFLLIKAFQRICTRYKVRLLLAGDGDFKRALSCVSPPYPSITFAGFLNQDTLHALYEIADIGVIPSHYEEFGYVAVEMMMHGLPILANRTSGLAEIIENGESGEVVDLYAEENEEKRVDLLAEKLILLLENENKRKKYSANSRQRYLEYFGKDTFKLKMVEIYDTLFLDAQTKTDESQPRG